MAVALAPTVEPEVEASRRARSRGWTAAVLVVALLPAVVAVWAVPWFVTQDGPAHLYNAHIIRESMRPDSPFQQIYQVRWLPLPNWVGHLALVALLRVVSPRAADRILMTVTLVGFACSVAWLRWRVAGWKGMPVAAALAALMALNVAWLVGFTSFLLGACLFPITLGVWWSYRQRLGAQHAAVLALLIVVGYFCHLVSMALTALGLVVLAAATPGPRRLRRWGWTMVSLLPLLPLGVVYRGLMRAGGGIAPQWEHLKNPLSLAAWAVQLGWIDPLSLASKRTLPFLHVFSTWCGWLTPIVWFSVAFGLLTLATADRVRSQGPREESGPDVLRAWPLLGALLLLLGMIGPDTMGPGHGQYLPQRVLLLGLVAVLPYLELDLARRPVRVAAGVLAVALVVQSATVWSYALEANRLVGQFLHCADHVGKDQRIGCIFHRIRGLYRGNPLLHADSLLGLGTGNVLWSNYETTHYYFPVQVRDAPRHPPPQWFEVVTILDDPRDAAKRLELWRDLLEKYHGEIDVLVTWGSDPALDAVSERWYRLDYQSGPVRVLKRRDAPAHPGPRNEPS